MTTAIFSMVSTNDPRTAKSKKVCGRPNQRYAAKIVGIEKSKMLIPETVDDHAGVSAFVIKNAPAIRIRSTGMTRDLFKILRINKLQ